MVINHHSSDPVPGNSGVLQGAVLDPLPFLIYKNDLLKRAKSTTKCLQMRVFSSVDSIINPITGSEKKI